MIRLDTALKPFLSQHTCKEIAITIFDLFIMTSFIFSVTVQVWIKIPLGFITRKIKKLNVKRFYNSNSNHFKVTT